MNMKDERSELRGKETIQGFRRGLAIFATEWLLAPSGPVLAQNEGKSADKVAKEPSNPAGALSSLFNTIRRSALARSSSCPLWARCC
jgi:hypothetical protein